MENWIWRFSFCFPSNVYRYSVTLLDGHWKEATMSLDLFRVDQSSYRLFFVVYVSLSLSLSLFRFLLFYTCNVSSSCSESTLLFAIQNIYLIFFSRAHELITRRRKYCSTSGTSIFSHIRSSDSREIFETRKSFGIFGSDKISIASLRRLFLVHCVLVTGFDVYSVFMQITRLACK